MVSLTTAPLPFTPVIKTVCAPVPVPVSLALEDEISSAVAVVKGVNVPKGATVTHDVLTLALKPVIVTGM
jgi:hypothetical protein